MKLRRLYKNELTSCSLRKAATKSFSSKKFMVSGRNPSCRKSEHAFSPLEHAEQGFRTIVSVMLATD